MAMPGEPSPQAATGGGAAAAGGTASAGTASGGGGGQEVVVGTAPRTATMFACVTTLSNTLLGVSVVGVAGGFSRAGYTMGTFYLMLFATLAGSGLHLLARCSMTVSAAARRKADAVEADNGGAEKGVLPPSSFRAVALVGAPRWAFLIDVAVALKCFGVATSYLVVIGDLMPVAMSDIFEDAKPDSLLLDRRVWVTVGFFLAAPLAFSRTLGALRYTATVAIGLVMFLAGMVFSFWVLPGLDACPDDSRDSASAALYGDPGNMGSDLNATSAEEISADGLLVSQSGAAQLPLTLQSVAEEAGEGFALEGGRCFEGSNAMGTIRTLLQTLPIFVFCFTCHQNIFTICNEIVRPTPARVDMVIVCSMMLATATYLSLSWGAYATFGTGVEGDLLDTYPRTGLLTIARICVSILVTSCYPLQAHPSRLCILSTWKAFSGEMEKAYLNSAPPGDSPPSSSTSPNPLHDSNGYPSGYAGNNYAAHGHAGSGYAASGYTGTSYPASGYVGGYAVVPTDGDGGVGGNDERQRNASGVSSSREGVVRERMILSGGNGCGGDLVNRGHGGNSSHGSSSGSSTTGAGTNANGGDPAEERGRRRVSPSSVVAGVVAGGRGSEAGLDGGIGRGLGADGSELDLDGGRLDSLEKEGLLNSDSLLGARFHDVPAGGGGGGGGEGGNGAQRGVGGDRGAQRLRGDHAVDIDVLGNGMLPGGAAAAAAALSRSGGWEGGGGERWFWTSPEGFRHLLVTGVFLGLSYVIAMAVDDLGVLLEVVGATGSTTIAFILPGLLYLKIHPEPHPTRSLAALQLVVGLFIIPVALTFIALGDPAEGRR